jgi:hypothetical protein
VAAVRNTNSRTIWFATGAVLLLVAGGVVAGSTGTTLNADGSTKLAFHAPWARQGGWVSYQADPASGTVSNYTLVRDIASRALFDSIQLQTNATGYRAIHRGPAYALVGGNATLVIFDAPNAGIDAVARDGATITFVAADGIGLAKHAADPGWSPEGVLIQVGNATARLVVDKGSHVDVSGQTIIVTLGAKGHLEMTLNGHPYQKLAEERALREMIRARRAN